MLRPQFIALRYIGALHTAIIPSRRAARLAVVIGDLIPSNSRVIDIGSGDGLLASMVMTRRPDVSISGIDIFQRPTSLIPVRVFDGTTIPYPDKSFDVATIVDVLHHTDDPLVMLREAARVAKVVIIKDHLTDEWPIAWPLLRFMDWIGNAPHGVRLPYNYFSSAQWADAFDQARLSEDARVDRLGLYPAPLTWLFDRKLHFAVRLRAK